MRRIRVFTNEEQALVRQEYAHHARLGQLHLLAKRLGRTKPFLCRQARALGLTDQHRPSPWTAVWKYVTEAQARDWFTRFKTSRLTMGKFCRKHHIDDLGFSRTMRRFFPDEWEAVIELKAPRQTKYRYGRAFEYRTRDDLRRKGYFVLRSPRSGSPVDLVALQVGKVLFVQCKIGAALGVREWNDLYDLACAVRATPVMASTPTGRGIVYQRLVARKDGSKKRQPLEAMTP